ncbi:MAG: hypothetical protein QM699_04430 [Amaricoccus sp.]|uniref:hypothetical protein n=1 Tax=Amaricoccus sp. TaxID=1872485 RepID=UPI0039E44394
MENTTVETFDYHTYTGGFGLIPLLIVLALLIVPYWKLWSRTGHSGAWALLMLVPLANLISLWVLAFKEWPAMRGR